ncbi:hypothetical protein [Ornithinibacillus contaminans]|uniref:hypothetical protein n=1 Tax=Ornithinibacillus contaminans TaxID=694055 RepID=UPI00064DEB55|nr:hypothetical protein [Ornithinibacillus contaminans]
MNVEINFLQKKTKKNLAPYLVGILVLLCVLTILATVFVQRYTLEKSVTEKREVLTQLEIVSSKQADIINENAINVQSILATLMQETQPTVRLYNDLLEPVQPDSSFISYQHTEENQLIIEAHFSSLAHVAQYISEVDSKSYVNDVQLTAVNLTDEGYDATLTVILNSNAAKEELREYESEMD